MVHAKWLTVVDLVPWHETGTVYAHDDVGVQCEMWWPLLQLYIYTIFDMFEHQSHLTLLGRSSSVGRAQDS